MYVTATVWKLNANLTVAAQIKSYSLCFALCAMLYALCLRPYSL